MQKKITPVLLIAAVTMLLTACFSNAYLIVNYQLPVDSHMLNGKSVYLVIDDQRTNKTFLTPKAKRNLKEFTGIFALYATEPDEKKSLIGSYEAPQLLEAIFKKRLNLLGVSMANQKTAGTPVFTVSFNEFKLDLLGNKWVANLAYRAELALGDSKATQSLSSKTERMRLMDKLDAEKMLKDIFSDTLNKLDVIKMFKDVGL